MVDHYIVKHRRLHGQEGKPADTLGILKAIVKGKGLQTLGAFLRY